MFIQTESTPNPATLKFLPGHTVLQNGTADFPSRANSDKSPLAKRIFSVEGVSGVFFGSDFITVTKESDTEWEHIKPAILGVILEHFQSGDPTLLEENAEKNHMDHDGPDAEIVNKISSNLGLEKNEVLATVENFMDEVKDSLSQGELSLIHI